MKKTGLESGLNLQATRLCLDFVNTADWHASKHPKEMLTSYADLVSWAWRTGLLSRSEADALLNRAASRPADASKVLEKAIFLREAIYRIFSAIAHDHMPKASDVTLLNDVLSAAMNHVRVESTTKGYVWGWVVPEGALDRIVWPIVRSAAELLTSAELERVGECADDRGCGWLFLDTSKNRSRRWCDMKDCGNRAKAGRHYKRQRAALIT